MASYNKNIDSGYTTQVQTILQGLGANLGAGGVDGKCLYPRQIQAIFMEKQRTNRAHNI